MKKSAIVLNNIQNIIFDFDGTLGDSSDDIIESLYSAFDAENISIPESVYFLATDIGPPIREIILGRIPELNSDMVDKITKKFRYIYDNGAFDKTKLYEGVRDLLHKLRTKNVRLFIATNKPILPTKNIIMKLDIDFFDEIVTPDVIKDRLLDKESMVSYLVGKWGLDQDKTIMVGDSPSDIIAAYKNKVLPIAVSYGYSDHGQLEPSKPFCIIDNIKQLSYIINLNKNDGINNK